MKILCDFDGTAARNDVGNVFFRTFAGARCFEIVGEWKSGKISSRECLFRESEITRITRPEFEAFVDGQELDPFFADFVEYCNGRGIETEIVSDGLDFYVDRTIKNHKLDLLVQAHANHLVFVGENRIRIEFPFFELGCGRCANCKGFHVREAKKQHDTVVYVGDGMSDRCGAREADVVFAKRGRDLLKFCRANAIEHHEFDTFQDVRRQLAHILNASSR